MSLNRNHNRSLDKEHTAAVIQCDHFEQCTTSGFELMALGFREKQQPL